MHGEQGGHPVERGAVADAGRDGDHRRGAEPTDHAGERPLHAGDHDHGVGGGHLVEVGEQAVEAGDSDVVEPGRFEPVGGERQDALVGDGSVRRSGRDDEDSSIANDGRWAVEHRPALGQTGSVFGDDRLQLVVGGSGQEDGPGAVGEQLTDDAHALLRRLAWPVHRFR